MSDLDTVLKIDLYNPMMIWKKYTTFKYIKPVLLSAEGMA